MQIQHDWKSHTYYIKEKIHNQTMCMKFEEYDRTSDEIYFNVVLGIYNKRKHAASNENMVATTGKYPFESVAKAIRAFNLLEAKIKELNYPKKTIIITWADNKRRDAYYKFLSKKGYTYGFIENQKCLYKKYTV